MSNLPPLTTAQKIIGAIILLLVIIGVVIGIYFGARHFMSPDTTETPTDNPSVATLPQVESDITSRTLLAGSMLDWFDGALDADGLYAADLACSVQDEATISACTPYNDDRLGGLSIVWARWKMHNQFLNEDLNAYLVKMQQTDMSASGSSNLASNNLLICNLMRDIVNDDNLDENTRALASGICSLNQTRKPNSILNDELSDENLNEWTIYLAENALQGNNDLVMSNFTNLTAVLENTTGQRILTAGNQCALSLLAESLAPIATDSGAISSFVSKYQDNYAVAEKINPLNQAEMAICALASSHGNFNREWLHKQIYNLHQNQAAQYGLNTVPLPFLSGVTDSQKPWLVNTWLNGLLIGGLVDY